MKTKLPKKSLEHQQRIEQIKDIIIKKGENKIAFIILFGSFARGDFVRDYYVKDGISYSYISDFDILIVMKPKRYKSTNLKHSISQHLQKYHLNRPHNVSLIIESLKHVNTMLEEGHYFFSDIKKEGILLYQDSDYKLSNPKELTNAEKRNIAQRHFDIWFKKGNDFLIDSDYAFKNNRENNAAFYLHQATESFFNCSALVLTDYKPKTHSLEELGQLCSSQSNEFLNIFPKATEEQKECFNLLVKSYIEARYDPDYKITKEQIDYLINRVEKLKEVTKQVSINKIKSFEK